MSASSSLPSSVWPTVMVRVAHVTAMAALVPDARLLLVPGNHGDYLGEVFAAGGDHTAMHATLPWSTRFLET